MMTGERNEKQYEALIDCLRALEAGADLEGWLAQHPRYAAALREHLALRERLLSAEIPEPAAYEYERGRQALLQRLHQRKRSLPAWLVAIRRTRSQLRSQHPVWGRFGWDRLGSPLARAGAAAAFLALLGGGVLGASAAAGFDPARNALSTLRILPASDGGEKDAGQVAAPPKRDGASGGSAPVKPTRTPESKRDDEGQDKPTATPARVAESTPTPKAIAVVERGEPTPGSQDIVRPKPTEQDEHPSVIRPTATQRREALPTRTPRLVEPTKTPEREPTAKPTKTAEPTKTPSVP